jgi:hypothetical protein
MTADYLRVKEAPTHRTIIFCGVDGMNEQNDNVDVEVRLPDGRRFSATFFTLGNLRWLFEKNSRTGECAGGLYFNCPDMVVVRCMNEETIFRTIDHLMETGDYRWSLRPLEPETEGIRDSLEEE